jgi:hypothetical protein
MFGQPLTLDLNFDHQNFAMNVVEAQFIDTLFRVDDSLTPAGELIQKLNILFISVFVTDLAANMVLNWGMPFFRNPWNVLDMGLILASVLSTYTFQRFVVFRLVRILRVLRIFGKVDVLRQIVSALGASLFPVGSAFSMLVIMICMCKYCLQRDYRLGGVADFAVLTPSCTPNSDSTSFSFPAPASGAGRRNPGGVALQRAGAERLRQVQQGLHDHVQDHGGGHVGGRDALHRRDGRTEPGP